MPVLAKRRRQLDRLAVGRVQVSLPPFLFAAIQIRGDDQPFLDAKPFHDRPIRLPLPNGNS